MGSIAHWLHRVFGWMMLLRLLVIAHGTVARLSSILARKCATVWRCTDVAIQRAGAGFAWQVAQRSKSAQSRHL